MTFIVMKKYQPVENTAALLIGAHAAVIDELLDATYEVQRLAASGPREIVLDDGRKGVLVVAGQVWTAARHRLERAQAAYFFVVQAAS